MEIVVIILCVLFLLIMWRWGCFVFGKGRLGEKSVASRLKFLPKEYQVLHDVIISNGKGSSQIDHIVVSQYGIFVIETKNYKGMIYGGENAQYWTQNIYGNKYELYNPILQNKSHINSLKRLLAKFGTLPFVSIVAISGRADVQVYTHEAHIVEFSEIRSLIKSFEVDVIPEDMVVPIVEYINRNRYVGDIVKSLHVDFARTTKVKMERAIKNGICPRCGGKLVIRNGKYGRFLGCSNYPNCKFTSKQN